MHGHLFAPNTASLGFGLFTAVAMLMGGGAFPLLPVEFQTFEVLLRFNGIQMGCEVATLLVGALASYRRPLLPGYGAVVGCAPLMCAGSGCLFVALYAPQLTPVLVTLAAVLLGIGAGMFVLLWQRTFAAQEFNAGALNIIVGTALAAPLYVGMSLLPAAVATLAVTFLFIPLIGVCLIDQGRRVSLDQPMFVDEPRAHAKVYSHAIGKNWLSALCTGGIAFAGGIARAVTLEDPVMGPVVNYFSMGGVLLAAVALVLLWRRSTFRFNTVRAFKAAFPVAVSAFVLLPYLNDTFLRCFAGLAWAGFTFLLMVLMIQCAQVSHSAGVNPVVLYGCFGAIVFAFQTLGFATGYVSPHLFDDRPLQLTTMSLSAVWVLALVMYQVGKRSDAKQETREGAEFIALEPVAEQDSTRKLRRTAKSVDEQDFKDRLSKQCAVLAERYLLTVREGEVLELMARGNTVPRMAELLVISENTVKTYTKRLYTKLGIHKREELLRLLEEVG